MVVNILVLAGPLYMLQVFDRVLTSRSTDTLMMLTVICVTALLTMALIEMVRSRITVTLSAWLDKSLSSTLFEGAVFRALAKNSAPSTQGLRDIRTMRGFISSPQLFAFFDAPWAPLFIFIMFMLHPYLGLVALAGAIILFILALLNETVTRRPAAEDGGANIAAMSITDATVRNADAVSAMGMMPALSGRWQEAAARSRASQALAEKRTAIIVATSKSARMVLQMMILGIGAWLAVAGEVTPGVMIAGSILMSRALAPVEQAIGGWRMMLGARQAYSRVREHLLTQPVVPTSMELPAPQGNLSVAGVSFMVDGQREPILRNVSFSLTAGESMAMIGPSGSGKSTLAKLLLGNLAPKAGHVRLDGMDVSTWSPNELGPHCGYLPQDIELFSGSVKDNIARMGEPVAEHVITAAQLAGCHELILALPGGYETQIGDQGGSLSGGTRQRIGLARALYGNPRFVVLDEPNSNLDGQGESALAGALVALKTSQATVVIIGHRQSTLEHADKVLMLKDGAVQAFGTKNEVLEQLGLKSNALPASGKPTPTANASTLSKKKLQTPAASSPKPAKHPTPIAQSTGSIQQSAEKTSNSVPAVSGQATGKPAPIPGSGENKNSDDRKTSKRTPINDAPAKSVTTAPGRRAQSTVVQATANGKEPGLKISKAITRSKAANTPLRVEKVDITLEIDDKFDPPEATMKPKAAQLSKRKS